MNKKITGDSRADKEAGIMRLLMEAVEIEELAETTARYLRLLFDQLVENGFTEQQAFDIIRDRPVPCSFE